MLTNRVLTASEAQDWGIVNKVVAPENVMMEAKSLPLRKALTYPGIRNKP